MDLFLAIDQSTSATKALLFDRTGRLADRESIDHRQLYPRAGWVEHDAEEIWANLLNATGTLLARHRADQIRCLSLTNQRETVVLFERGSGRPVRPAVVWQCRRGDPYCMAQIEAGRTEAIQERTGLRPDAYFSASKLQWVMEHEPQIAARVAKGEVLIGTIDAYIIYRLTQGAVFATDATNASRTLLYDIAKLNWDEQLCVWWDVPRIALPEVRNCTAVFGHTDLEGLLPTRVPICGVMGDSQAALFGEGCFSPGTAKITFGTGSSILLNIGRTPRFSRKGVVTSLAWQVGHETTYAFEGIIISSASTMTWLRDQLGAIKSVEETEALAQELPDNEGVYLVPAFSGLGLPYWEPSARAAIVGLSSQSDRRHIARAGLESIAYQVRDALDAMKSEAGVAVREVRANGGATANKFLMQFTADLTGAELRVSSMADRSALGAVMAGWLGLGIVRRLEDLPVTSATEEMVYCPRGDASRVDRMYAGWQRAVRQTLV
jgi:glycerol kinase